MKKLSRHVRVVRSRVSAIRALVVVPNSRMNGGFGREVEIILDFGKGSYRTKAVNFYSDAGNLSYIEVSSFVLRYKVHQL
jgi:hypothetical protein